MTSRTEYRADVLRYNGVGAALRTIISDVEHGIDRITRHQTTAAQAAAAPTPTEEHMFSLATLEEDLGKGVQSVENEFGKLKESLPGYVAEVRKIAASPLGQLAITAGEHVANGFLPPQALAVVESGAAKLLDDLLKLYNPQGLPAAPEQPAEPAPAQQA